MERSDDYKILSFNGSYIVDGEMWVSNSFFNGIFRINLETCTAQYVTSFIEEPRWKTGLHHKVYMWERTLYFCPDTSSGIHSYNLDTGEQKYFQLVAVGQFIRIRGIDSFQINNKLYIIFAYSDNPIIIFDMNDETIEIQYPKVILGKNVELDKGKPLIWSHGTIHNHVYYAVVWDRNYIYRFDLEANKISILNVGNERIRLSSIVNCNNKFWLCDMKKSIVYRWNEENNKLISYEVKTATAEDEGYSSSNCLYSINHNVLLGLGDGSLWSIREENGPLKSQLIHDSFYRKQSDIRKNWRIYFGADIYENKLYIYPLCNIDLGIITVDAVDESMKYDSVFINTIFEEAEYLSILEEERKNVLISGTKKEQISGPYSLAEYLKFVESTEKSYIQKTLSHGKKIWEEIKKELF